MPNCSDINYNDIDANAASYVTDLKQKNTITISEITDKTITGKFELFYKKGIGGNLDDYPNSLHIVCSKFVAVR